MSDQYILQKSESDVTNPISEMNDSYIIRLPDSNFSNYSSSQVVFNNLASLANYNANLSLAESYIEIPYTVTMSGTNLPTDNQYALGLKGFMNLIHSYEITIDDQVIENVVPMSHIPANFRLLSSMSEDAMNNSSDEFNYKKDLDNIEYADKLGECNQYDNSVTDYGNKGQQERMEYTNFDPAETRNALYTNEVMTKARRQSYYKAATGKMTYFYMAIIPLKHLSQFFANSVLQKGTYLKLLLNVNTATTNLTVTTGTGAITAVSTTSSFNYCPYMLSKSKAGLDISAAITAVTIKSGIIQANATDATPFGTTCNFVAKFYKMDLKVESNYFSRKTRAITHEKFINSTLYNVAPGLEFDHLASASVNKMRYILIVPLLSANTNGRATPALNSTGSAFSVLNSPFTNAGQTTSFGANIQNFNILVNAIQHYKNPVTYNHELFTREIVKANAISGAHEMGINSGLISLKDFQTHMGFVYVDMKRKENELDDNISVPVQIVGINNNLNYMDYHIFICQEVVHTVDITTGKLVV